MTVKIRFKKLAAVAVLGSLSLVGLGSAAAIGAETPADFNAATKGSLTIHKHFGDEGLPGDGRETTVDSTAKPPLSGVQYKIEKVTNVDLTTNAGWKTAALIAENKASATLGDAKTGTTGNDGSLKFSDLAVGLYKVTETDNSQAKKNGQGKPIKAKLAAPFYVTIPLTDPVARQKWLYNVHVYPKNQEFQVAKEGKLIAGDTMEYTVTATLPALAAGKKYEKYNLIDQLSSNHNVSTFAVTKVVALADEADKAPTELAADKYTVDNTSKAAQNIVFVRFNDPAGLEALATASAAGKKLVRYTYTVKLKDEFKAGDLTNEAFVAPSNEYADEPNNNTPNQENVEKFVQFQIEKQDANNTSTKLEGAVFDLYSCTADGKFADKDGKEVADKAQAVKIANVTTQAGGKTPATRMPVTGDTSNVKKICAVETKAPEGYSLLAEPVVFDIADQADTLTTPIVKTIDNVKQNAGFNLPLTGANGLAILSIAGIALIAGAFTLTVRNRKNS